jgi:hypothetical protein
MNIAPIIPQNYSNYKNLKDIMHLSMGTTEIFLIAMLIIFTVPYLIWRLADTDYYAPLVVVQILTGVLLGPGILGPIRNTTNSFSTPT